MHPEETRKCPQCLQAKAAAHFIGKTGKLVQWCLECRDHYQGWEKLSVDEKLRRTREKRARIDSRPILRVRLVLASKNRKTGPIPVSSTSAFTCPPTCSWYGGGCYAELGLHSRLHWNKVPEQGLTWKAFCEAVRGLPEGQVWRHNEAGDLPGEGVDLDEKALEALVPANRGRRGFTFTHKPLIDRDHANAILEANRQGFTINLSADTLKDADRLADLEIGPVAVVLPRDYPDKGGRTPRGRRVVVCPAETHATTCARCKLCSRAQRPSIVGFRAHGPGAGLVESQIVQLRIPGA